MKLFKWIWEHILFILTLFLLAFIPLYPKKPLLDIEHTWVYIRAEDFIVAIVIGVWTLFLLRKKVTLKTPLTLSILLFWIIGGIATLHGVLLIFPTLSGIFSNVALLSFLRHIEYMFLFFIGYSAIKDKKFIYYVIGTLVIVLLSVIGYGFGQKYLGFPAYLTMNEEFAKGVPIQLSELSRIPSTFAGHYDLAAYLVLIIPFLVSIAFGVKNWILKIILLSTSALGFGLLLMTVSRVSVFVLFLSLVLLLTFYKKKLLIISLALLTILFLSFSPSLLARFGSTVTEIDVLVDAQTGQPIGNVKQDSSEVLKEKIIVRKTFENNRAVFGINKDIIDEDIIASTSAIIPFSQIPSSVFLLVESNAPTGENLPQGTGYINLQLSPIKEKIHYFYFQVPAKNDGLPLKEVVAFSGNFLVKRAKAYDLSFTTRFQGEWPRTIEAFKRNIFLGSGYGSVSLAVDNNYLRILGESGLLGLASFLSIFFIAGIYIKKVLPNIDSPILKSFVFGFGAGSFGLFLNAVLIDVFEASKIAFSYWLLMGITLGLLNLYKKEEFDLLREFKKAISSSYTVVVSLFIITFALFSGLYKYYFIGDDFTWLRWVADCANCSPISAVIRFFTESDGFFYRPGTKVYFYLMHSAFWLNQAMYHLVSIFLHFSFAVLLFLVAKRVFKNFFLSASSAVLFLILSGNSEDVLWISAVGYLFNGVFTLLGLLSFMYWREKRKFIYLIGSILCIALSMLFHEVGVIVPLLIILYDVIFVEKTQSKTLKNSSYLLLLPILPYLFLRFISNSHWFNGDYSYNMLKLPFNFVGNAIGYFMLALLGPMVNSPYQAIRAFSREHILLGFLFSVVAVFIGMVIYRVIARKMNSDEQKIILFGFLFFIISLLPFLGLGNIAARYNYLSSVSFVIIYVLLLKKLYDFLSNMNGRYIARISIVLVLIVFSSVHLFQLQKMHADWSAAGERSERFIISLNEMYSDGWTKNKINFYFVDVPIRYGEAWIFPVGLKDALWFVYKNNNINTYQVSSGQSAFNIIRSLEDKVFQFDINGRLVELIKTQGGKIVPKEL